MVVAVGLIVLGIAVSVLTLGAGIKKGIALGGIAGIVLAGLTIAGAGYTIVNSIASIAELFSNHGCNFMRDGLFGGNAGLHRAVSLSAGVVMLAGGLVGKKLAGVKVNAAKMGKAQQVTQAADVTTATSGIEQTFTKAELKAARQKAVREAWANEIANVQGGGDGSGIWTEKQLNTLRSGKKVKGMHGHHMKSVQGYPHLAGDATNVQFLTPEQHLLAHGGNWRNITHGRFLL